MVIPAAAGAASSLIAGGLSYIGQKSTNRANRKIAREQMAFQRESAGEQMAFQERMSNTAYQRAMADMSAAGLNPILAYNQGGANAPAGASQAGASIAQQNPFANAVNSALEAKRMVAEVSNLKEQNKNLQKLNAEIESRARLNNASAKSVEYTLPGKKLEADIDQQLGGNPAFALKWLERLLGPLNFFKKR